MSSTTWGSPPAPLLLTGSEPIDGTGAALRDFWAWSMLDLRANTVRSVLAEFLVAQAVGAAAKPRIEWDAYDVLTPERIRLEVKSSAYLQAWKQPQLSTVVFGGLSARTWSPTDGYSTASSYNADVYVFAVLTATEHDKYDALDVAQWSFWVLPVDVVGGSGQRSMRLSRIEALAGPAVPYAALAQRIREVAAGQKGTAGR